MKDFSVPYSKVSSADEAFEAIKQAAESGAFSNFKVKVNFDFFPETREILSKGKGFKLSLTFQDDAVNVGLELGLIYKALRSKIEGGLQKELKRRV